MYNGVGGGGAVNMNLLPDTPAEKMRNSSPDILTPDRPLLFFLNVCRSSCVKLQLGAHSNKIG